MKYLSETMTETEAKRIYRSWAKKLHPDLGGDEEEFKILADEYSKIQRKISEPPIANIKNMMEAAGVMVNIIANTLTELYPRTRVSLYYTPTSIDAEFSGNVPVERMVAIEQIISSFEYPFNLIVYFKRDARKSPIQLCTKGNVTWINTPAGVEVDVKEPPVYNGRRYILHRGTKYEQCLDKKYNRLYVMRRIPKYSLQELMGIGK